LLAACLFAGLSAGCVEVDGDGNNAYTMKSPYPEGIRTVHVPIWTRSKDVYRRDLEFRLTEAVIKRIEMQTPYKITTRARADSELAGEIIVVEQGVLGFNPDTGNPRELELALTMAFTWKNLRTGEILTQEPALSVSGTYIPDEPLGEDFFQGSQSVIEDAAIRIVESMEAEWGSESQD
jgi:hypothetical protein